MSHLAINRFTPCHQVPKRSRRANGRLTRFALVLAVVLLCASGNRVLSAAEIPPDDEKMVEALKPYKGRQLTAAQRAQIAQAFATNFIPTHIVNYFQGMDAVSVLASGTEHKAEPWPDQLLDQRRDRPPRHLVDIVGKIPDTNGNYVDSKEHESEVFGRNTWMIWCGGNEAFWDWLANHSLGFMDLLKVLDSRTRATRWRDAGLVNEPGMREATVAETNEFGLWLDQPEDARHAAYRRQTLAEFFNQGKAGDYYSETNYPELPAWRIYGLSSGIVGLRIFPNPKFDDQARKRWDATKYYNDPKYSSDPELVRPFRVGMSCAFCHASAHPLNPPPDPAHPRWDNLSGSIGSQYLRIRGVFGNLLEKTNFVYHLLDSQPPGTIDTSLIASDNINNPNTMNAIFCLPQRVQRAMANPPETASTSTAMMPSLYLDETPAHENPRRVPRILLDGADSVGVWVALARVYLNIGTYSEQWVRLHEPLIGFLPPAAAQTPAERKRTQLAFKIKDCQEHSVYWQATQLRVEPLRDYFLKITPPMPLLDANGPDNASKRIQADKLARGRRVFARNCIVCHSSIQPESNPRDMFHSDPADIFHQQTEPSEEVRKKLADYVSKFGSLIYARSNSLAMWAANGEFWDHDPGQWLRRDDYTAWASEVVDLPEFWRNNFLSTDYRVPVNYVGTNPGRALANNSTSGHMWEDFSSDSYRALPSVGSIPFFNPYKGPHGADDLFSPRHATTNATEGGGGPGFYRPPSLVSIWATAPFLHNNSLGLFNNDPSVRGRMDAFNDAIHKLLWIEQRKQNTNYASAAQLEKDHGLIWRTPTDTYLIIPGKHVPAFARRLPRLSKLDGVARHFEKLGGWKAAPAATLLVLAFVILVLSNGAHRAARWQRVAGYALLGLALVTGFLAYFLAGGLGDLRLGPIPAGTPVDLLANLNPDASPDQLKKSVQQVVSGLTEIQTRHLEGETKAQVFRSKIAPALLDVSKCPDFVMDKGHYFPWLHDITDEDKEALIELLKTF